MDFFLNGHIRNIETEISFYILYNSSAERLESRGQMLPSQNVGCWIPPAKQDSMLNLNQKDLEQTTSLRMRTDMQPGYDSAFVCQLNCTWHLTRYLGTADAIYPLWLNLTRVYDGLKYSWLIKAHRPHV